MRREYNFGHINSVEALVSTQLFARFSESKVERECIGDQVKQGDQIGEIGFSGDAFIPHLHYMLTNNADPFRGEGLPSYFHNFRRILGSTDRELRKGQIDSGDIVEPNANRSALP
jgi:hypothetical protein